MLNHFSAMILLLPSLALASGNGDLIRQIESLAAQSQKAKPAYQKYYDFLLRTGLCKKAKRESAVSRLDCADQVLKSRKDWEQAVALVRSYPGIPAASQEMAKKILELRDASGPEAEGAVKAAMSAYTGLGLELRTLQKMAIESAEGLKLGAEEKMRAADAVFALTERICKDSSELFIVLIQLSSVRSLVQSGFLAVGSAVQADIDATSRHAEEIKAMLQLPGPNASASPRSSEETGSKEFLASLQEEVRQSATLGHELAQIVTKMRAHGDAKSGQAREPSPK